MMENEDIPNSPAVSQGAAPAAGGGANPVQTVRQRKVNRWRLAWFFAALILLVSGTSWFCFLQPPAPVAAPAEKFSWKKWLWQPHEQNALKRLTTVPDADLHGAFFTGKLGWAVGNDGVIVHTKDGGQSWELQTNIIWPELAAQAAAQDSYSVPAKKSFSVGQVPPAPLNPAANALNAAQNAFQGSPDQKSPEQNVLNSKMPEFKAPPNLPKNLRPPWEPTTAPASPVIWSKRLNAVCFVNGNSGWAVGENGVMLRTADGGESWATQVTGTEATLSAVSFVDAQTGWAAGFDGTLIHTGDGGKNWEPQDAGGDATLESIVFADKDHGWAAGFAVILEEARRGILLRTDDGGKNWRSQKLFPGLFVYSMSFPDATQGWVAGLPEILHTGDGGTTWESQAKAGPNSFFSAIQFVDAQTGWAVESSGNIWRTTDGGKVWTPEKTATNSHPLCLRFVNRQTGWAAGVAGKILRSDDGGKTWNGQTLNAALQLRSEDFEKWAATHTYSRWPAAMFYAVLLLSLVFLRIGLIKQTEPEKFTPSIADFAVSDRPLTSKDFDALNFGPLAQGIANFLRNKSTTGPLTMAVAGPWGSGKSSIMGLLREKLERQGIRPVWFNAWHHQDEKQLLAALLENIRSQAVPPWYSWRGAAFRMKLINRRMHREWPMLFVGALFLASFAALLHLLVRDGLSWNAVTEMVSKPDLFSAGKLAVLATALVTGWKILQGFQAFGLNPAKLLASVTEKAKLSDLGEQTSFRHRFAQEFEDVTAALQPRTMTVFIDDLDRCEPDQVMSVMQSLNFLSSSGECFLIIGMEENAVTNCVAISLKEQFDSQQGHKLDEAASVQERWKYARLWMEKLIQIRIPVPDASDDQFRTLLTGKISRPADEVQRRNLVVQWASRCWAASLPALPWAGLLAVVLAGFFLTSFELDHWPWLKEKITRQPEPPPVAVAWPSNSIIQPGGLASVKLTVPDGVSGRSLMTNANFEQWLAGQKWTVNLEFTPNLSTNRLSFADAQGEKIPDLPVFTPNGSRNISDAKPVALTIIPGQKNYGGWWLALPFLIVVLVYGWKKIAEILEQRYGDSDDFRRALHRWSGVIQADAGTPRAAKRLINKLRFYAMMSRALKSANMADINENVVVAFGVNEHRISHGTVVPDEKLGGLLRAEAKLNPDGAVKSIATDLRELESAWQRQAEIFRYLSSTVKTEGGGKQKAG